MRVMIPHKKCKGTGWLTPAGSERNKRCSCENGLVLVKVSETKKGLDRILNKILKAVHI